MAARYGLDVTVCESHSIPGGAAQGWKQDGYHFEAGPSLYSGMASTGRGANPLAHVLQAIGEPLDIIKYNGWNVMIPEGQFVDRVGTGDFISHMHRLAGPEAVADWKRLQTAMEPYTKAAAAVPSMALRQDPAAAITLLGRYLPSLFSSGTSSARLIKPASEVLDEVTKNPFIRHWMDLLCFLLQGQTADNTILALIAFMFADWYKPNASLEFPRGGSMGIVSALLRGLKKKGGRLLLNTHVEQIVVEGGRAVGVRLRDGNILRARKAVVSNASVWDTVKLVPADALPVQWRQEALATPPCDSFMHLHLGFDATGLEGLEMHHIVVQGWEQGVQAEQNVTLVSIASIQDPKLAPKGKHTLHAYHPATEPFSHWQHLQRGTPEYEQKKQERSQALWRAVEKCISDIHERTEIELVGTPLTHQHFVRKHRGTYGHSMAAGKDDYRSSRTPVAGLLCCGDSVFPGIGVPAVAASGAIAANSLVPIWAHWKMLNDIGV
ncbi:hypothetical protein WJX84_009761 [Apatococcus fuscideae]|uniref:Amine oxidase domain-containing protein n=1 Tax=Apatococcus fuscideae TaxID=2026836 RepID=A0AAW1TJ80_9CHLO